MHLDAGETLGRCLASVRGQNHRDVEIVVVDNGSTDGTLDVARRFADIVMLGGPERSAQRNTGARVATGELLARVNNDVAEIQRVVSESLLALVGNVLFLVGSIGAMFWLDTRLALIGLILGLAWPASGPGESVSTPDSS